MRTRDAILKVKYENLVVLAEIAKVQCVSTAASKIADSIQICN